MRGITFIETIVYIALLSLFLVAAVTTGYDMVETSAHEESALTNEEGWTFLREKLDWAFQEASSVEISDTGDKIILHTTNPRFEPIRIEDSHTGMILLSEGTSAALPINTPLLHFHALVFQLATSSENSSVLIRIRTEKETRTFERSIL